MGHGDDHEMEVIGWATCWEGCDDDAHRAVVDFLISRGARHHIFSAIASNLGDEVRRIVSRDPPALTRRMSRNENNMLPLQFAIRMQRPEMVGLLVELGADPLGVDGSGQPAAMYAESPEIDAPIMR
ncbi:MAG: ankyrin repeat domain-containing protein, partial [Betaproteobacteria bacterium]